MLDGVRSPALVRVLARERRTPCSNFEAASTYSMGDACADKLDAAESDRVFVCAVDKVRPNVRPMSKMVGCTQNTQFHY